MRKWLEYRSIQIALAMAVLVIWGYNMSTLAEIVIPPSEHNSPGAITIDSSLLELPDSGHYTYGANFRDPFQHSLIAPRKKVVKPTKPKEKPEPVIPPKLDLTGVIEETALIEDSRRGLFFVAVGDTVAGAKIISVTPDSVILKFKNKTFTIKIR